MERAEANHGELPPKFNLEKMRAEHFSVKFLLVSLDRGWILVQCSAKPKNPKVESSSLLSITCETDNILGVPARFIMVTYE